MMLTKRSKNAVDIKYISDQIDLVEKRINERKLAEKN